MGGARVSITRRLGVAVLAGVVALVGAPVASAGPTLPLERHTCGESIFHSFRLANNLGICAGNGFNVAHQNVIIDLNGHRITGSAGSSQGIAVFGENGVTVRNGVIASFAGAGIVSDSDDGTFRDLKVVGSPEGIQTFGDHNIIERNILAHDGSGVFLAQGANDNTVRSNGFYGGSGGVSLNGANGADVTGNVIVGNRVLGGSTAGIFVGSFTDGTKVIGNTVEGNASGIHVTSGAANEVSNNTVRGNGMDGIVITDAGGVVAGNAVTGSATNGIHVGGTASHLLLSGNVTSANQSEGVFLESTVSSVSITKDVANENGFDGILSQTATVKLTDNTTNFNGYRNGVASTSSFGIHALFVTGSGNVAKGNASGTAMNGHQCSPATACSEGSPLPPPLVLCNFQPATGSTVTLHNPLSCPTVAIQVVNNNVTLHLGRHRVNGGTSNGNASVLVSGVSGAILTGGVLAGSFNGLRLFQASHAIDTGSMAVGNASSGVFASSSDHIVIKKVIVTMPTGDAMDFTGSPHVAALADTVAGGSIGGIGYQAGSDHAVLIGNHVFGVTGVGIGPTSLADAVIKNNTVVGSAFGNPNDPAYLLSAVTSSLIESNTAAANAGSGFLFTVAAAGNRLVANAANANGQDGVTFDNSADNNNFLLSNTTTDNDQQGIKFVGATPSGNVVKFNVVEHNGSNGIYVNAATDVAQVSANTVIDNGFRGELTPNLDDYGINAPSGTHGHGNVAKKNDNPAQCTPASLC